MSRFVVIVLLALLAMPAFADLLTFPNLMAKSPNGSFMATAESPDNRSDNQRPFQRNFTIALQDTHANKEVWTYKQKEDESSPVELIPTDDGYLIMHNARYEYYVFDKQGNPKKVFAILETFPEEEKEKFAVETTGGIMWKQYSKKGFFIDERKLYLYIRTYWGRLTVIDISTVNWVQNAILIKKIENTLIQNTKEWIKTFDNNYYFKCNSCENYHLKEEIVVNAFIIKKYDLPGGEIILHEILSLNDDNRYYDFERCLNLIEVISYQKKSTIISLALIISIASVIIVAVFLKSKLTKIFKRNI